MEPNSKILQTLLMKMSKKRKNSGKKQKNLKKKNRSHQMKIQMMKAISNYMKNLNQKKSNIVSNYKQIRTLPQWLDQTEAQEEEDQNHKTTNWKTGLNLSLGIRLNPVRNLKNKINITYVSKSLLSNLMTFIIMRSYLRI